MKWKFPCLIISDMDNIIPLFIELANPSKDKKIYLFFDEIQDIKFWEKYIRRIYDTSKYKIFISGSSSKLLSREISTSLRGRNIEYTMMPLSFHEYLEFNRMEYSNLTGYTDQRGYILSELNNYLKYGGYPEVALEKDNNADISLLSISLASEAYVTCINSTIFKESENKKMSYNKKIYSVDPGIIYALKNEMSITRLMKNIVFLELNHIVF